MVVAVAVVVAVVVAALMVGVMDVVCSDSGGLVELVVVPAVVVAWW